MESIQSQVFGKYFLEEERDQQEQEFLNLVQGNWTVREYNISRNSSVFLILRTTWWTLLKRK